MARPRAYALLIDCDGVLRQYDPMVNAAVETRYGVIPGTVLAIALEHDIVHPAVTGRVTRDGWLHSIADALAERGILNRMRAYALAHEWGEYRGELVRVACDFVHGVQDAGRPTALAANANDELEEELCELGLGGFTAIVNSWRLGVAKPAPEYFAAACAAVDTAPERCLFVDDNDRNVRGARAAGLSAYRWNGPADLPYLRAALALDGASPGPGQVQPRQRL